MKFQATGMIAWGLLAYGFLMFVGCGNPDSNEPAHSNKRACALISKEQVSTILGEPFGSPQERTQERDGKIVMSMCTFTPVAENSVSSFTVSLIPQEGKSDSQEALDGHLRSMREGLGTPDYAMDSVNEVGEAAAYDHEMGQLTAFESGQMFIFTLMRNPREQNKALLIKLAQTTLSGT